MTTPRPKGEETKINRVVPKKNMTFVQDMSKMLLIDLKLYISEITSWIALGFIVMRI